MKMKNEFLERFGITKINPELYGNLIVSGSMPSELTQEEFESGKQGIVYLNAPIDRNEYERQLKERQERHLSRFEQNWRPCLHDQCTRCHGTGINQYGHTCVHGISCSCPKCSPTC